MACMALLEALPCCSTGNGSLMAFWQYYSLENMTHNAENKRLVHVGKAHK